MTPEEAIEKFEKIKRGSIFLIHQRIDGKEVFDDYSLCDMAISALEKQIPVKATFDSDMDYVECPVCCQLTNANGFPEDINYCYHCGQAFDWGNE